MQKEARSMGADKSRAPVLESAGNRFLATFELKPLAYTAGQDADFARLMDVNVRFSARPWFRAALLGTGGG